MQSEIESLSTNKLLLEMKAANDADIWDRRHQLIGSTLSYRAVVGSNARYGMVRTRRWYCLTQCRHGMGGIIRKVWAMGRTYVVEIEQKSYQASITKGMIKAGYIRTTSSGRYIKWIVPRPNKSKGKAAYEMI